MRTVMVSGASGIVGYGILDSLRGSGLPLRLLGTTIYTHSVASVFSDVVEIAPPTSAPEYLGWLLDVIARHQVALLIPGLEVDVHQWLEHADALQQGGARLALNSPSLIRLCRDKWSFYEVARERIPKYVIDSEVTPDFDFLAGKWGVPFLLKPRIGTGSRGIVRVDSRATFLAHRDALGQTLMAQPIVGTEDEEYSVSAFCDEQGTPVARLGLRRRLSREGSTGSGEVVEHDGINAAIDEVCRAFTPVGPTNFQFRIHDGVPQLLEINPRISSATSIRAAFGYNEAQMTVEWLLDGRRPAQPPTRRGRAIRYLRDHVEYL